jgi:SHS2 domain-containing protein
MARPPFEEIEHTADWALRVRGPNHAALFAAAARGMFGLLAELDAVDASVERRITLQSLDVEALLVDWLNELLYLAEAEHMVFTRFEIDRIDVGPDGNAALQARAWGGPAPELRKTIKAATFSGLNIQRTATGLQVDLVFDV